MPPYDRPPIQECVVEFRFRSTLEDGAKFKSSLQDLKADYPHFQEQWALEAQFDLKSKWQQGAQKVTGVVFDNRKADNPRTRVGHFLLDRFVFSQLPPYVSWDSFLPETQRLYSKYMPVGKPERILRIASRTINRLEIPGETANIEEYFKMSTKFPDSLPRDVVNFLTKLTLNFDDGIRATIIMTLPKKGKPESVGVIFDTDVYKTCNLPPDSESVWEILEQIHQIRNQIFEECITDKTRALIGDMDASDS